MLTKEQVEFYTENGYLVIEDALAPEQLAALREVTFDLMERSRGVIENDDVYDLDVGHSADSIRLTRIKLPHTRHPAYRDVLGSERLVSRLTPLLGPDIRLHTSKLNTKAPGGGAAVEWHQDWAFYPHTNDDLLAIGIMLDDVGPESGPLMVIPGTHRGPILDHSVDGIFCGAVDPDDPELDLERAVALTGKAGAMSLHHVRTLHGSAPNLSGRARLLLLYECGAADAWPIVGGSVAYAGMTPEVQWASMNERVICGTQGLQPRLENVPVKMPLPPAPDSTSIFEVQRSGRARSAFARAN